MSELIQNPEEIELNQNQTAEFLGNPPGRILLFGPSLMLGVVLLCGLLSWLIKYPDII